MPATIGEAIAMWSRTNGSINTDDGRKKTVSITEGYTVVTSADATWPEVTGAANLPQTGDFHPQLVWLICKRKNPKRITPIYWVIEVTYEGEIGPNGPQDSPLNDPPEIGWSKVDSDEPIDEDVDGNPIATACGEKFDGITMTISDLVLTVKRNYLGIDLNATYQYLHSVNSDTFAGFAPGTGHMTAFSANHVIAEEIGGYWEVTASVTFRYPWRTTPERAWWKRVKHEGYYCKQTVDGVDKVIRCVDKSKEPVTRPVPLDENGFQLEDPTDETAIVWKEFQVYNDLSYNALGLL